MQILPLKNVLFEINLEDCKNHFWRSILKIALWFSLQMALHVFFSILKINFKDHFFQIFKKNLDFFFQFFFFNFFFQFFFHFHNLQYRYSKWFLREKKIVISEIRTCDPWLTSSPLCLCATGLLWKQSKMSEYGTICVFWWWL